MSDQPSASDDDVSQSGDTSFDDQLGAAVRGSALGRLDPGSAPTASALLTAMGGVRGLVESIAPGIVFLVLFATTRNIVLSVVVPLLVSLGFVAWRVLQRGQPVLAFAGLVGLAISAVVALITGRGEDNFLWGFTVNAVSVIVIVISLALRRPIVGIVVGALAGKPYAWRTEKAKRSVAWRATVMWLAVVAARLAVQVPIYLAADAGQEGAVEALAIVKLLMGAPLYITVLWVTWLMVRSVLDTPDLTSSSQAGRNPR